MNQTKKRLQIIKLAISVTDIETIQLQILKLEMLQSDTKIKEISDKLKAGNYAQVQSMIDTYIETPTETIIQRTITNEFTQISSTEPRQEPNEQDQAIIDAFDLLVSANEKEEPLENISYEEMLSMEEDNLLEANEHQTVDFDALLNIDASEVLSDNINIDISSDSEVPSAVDPFFATEQTAKEKTNEILPLEEDIDKDTFFDKEEDNDLENDESIQTITPTQKEPKVPSRYASITYIKDKFQNLTVQYPPLSKNTEKFSSVDALLRKISHEGYNETEIEETLSYVKQLTTKGEKAEAASLLLVLSASKSNFAHFMLARELYKGTILEKNIGEAFTIMHRLATDNYPEALCDLAQFYEYGIGTSRNKSRAKALYKEASNLGIKRAIKHYKKL
ncbi:MAG: hypothetical protein DRQ78_02240 [Epsilonproteobacteria bacterium]|nr:MAG: hypothetical protein DRQ78_02240 [Campylobacterota bacterium]